MLITAVFDLEDEALFAIEALESAGIDRAQIGVLTTRRPGQVGPTNGQGTGGGLFLASDVRFDAESAGIAAGAWAGSLGYVGAVTAAGAVILSGGGLGLALGALIAAGSAGGLVGALVASGFHRAHAEFVRDQLASGGLAIWVETPSARLAEKVRQLLVRHGAVHILERGAE